MAGPRPRRGNHAQFDSLRGRRPCPRTGGMRRSGAAHLQGAGVIRIRRAARHRHPGSGRAAHTRDGQGPVARGAGASYQRRRLPRQPQRSVHRGPQSGRHRDALDRDVPRQFGSAPLDARDHAARLRRAAVSRGAPPHRPEAHRCARLFLRRRDGADHVVAGSHAGIHRRQGALRRPPRALSGVLGAPADPRGQEFRVRRGHLPPCHRRAGSHPRGREGRLRRARQLPQVRRRATRERAPALRCDRLSGRQPFVRRHLPLHADVRQVLACRPRRMGRARGQPRGGRAGARVRGQVLRR